MLLGKCFAVMMLSVVSMVRYASPLIAGGRIVRPFRRCFTQMASDTIYALSSGGNTKSGVAVVRISGPDSLQCLEAMTSVKTPFVAPKPRMASLRSLYCPESKELLDKALVLWFPSPHSFTGEDVVELHVHGSKAVLAGLFQSLAYLDGLTARGVRAAERGEFTQRAFENGKMDLTEVEGLADLLVADTAQQRKQALRQMEGHLRKAFETWREVLIKCLAHTEAVIDFGDDDREGDITDSAMVALHPALLALRAQLLAHLQDGRKGEIIRDGVQVALCGPPNAGKSSLMNHLARRPAAIVSPIAGTTRDVVEVRMDIGGYPCIVRDTAGLRVDSSDVIEQEGMRRAREAYENAHIKIFVADASDQSSVQESLNIFSTLVKQHGGVVPSRYMFILNKADLPSAQTVIPLSPDLQVTQHFISCATGQGLDELEKGLADSLMSFLSPSNDAGSAEDSVLITRERHRRHVKNCVEHLDNFINGMLPMDAAAEEIRFVANNCSKLRLIYAV